MPGERAGGESAEPNRVEAPKDAGPWQLFILILCIWAIIDLGAEAVLAIDPTMRTILGYADIVVCGIFFVDFLHSLATAPDRLRYMATWGWLDLVSSIPVVGPHRLGRIARIVRVLRVFRMVRSVRTLDIS